MTTIRLSDVELMLAANVGLVRHLSSRDDGISSRSHVKREDEWGIDIDGAAAEVAVAKHLGVYWVPGVRTFKSPDVGRIQVRSTRVRSGCLIVRPNDADDDLFLLVITDAPIFHLIGSLRGRDAKRLGRFEDDAWFVPQQHLRPIPSAESLRR